MRAAVSRMALVVACAATPGPSAPAQTPDACTYDRCALRFEEPFLLRGAAGTDRVARLSWWSTPTLASLVQRSDSALYHARFAEARQRHGVVAGGIALVGGVAAAVWMASNNTRLWDAEAGPLVLLLGSELIAIYAQYELREARRSLSRAMWWYNRDLPR